MGTLCNWIPVGLRPVLPLRAPSDFTPCMQHQGNQPNNQSCRSTCKFALLHPTGSTQVHGSKILLSWSCPVRSLILLTSLSICTSNTVSVCCRNLGVTLVQRARSLANTNMSTKENMHRALKRVSTSHSISMKLRCICAICPSKKSDRDGASRPFSKRSDAFRT